MSFPVNKYIEDVFLIIHVYTTYIEASSYFIHNNFNLFILFDIKNCINQDLLTLMIFVCSHLKKISELNIFSLQSKIKLQQFMIFKLFKICHS